MQGVDINHPSFPELREYQKNPRVPETSFLPREEGPVVHSIGVHKRFCLFYQYMMFWRRREIPASSLTWVKNRSLRNQECTGDHAWFVSEVRNAAGNCPMARVIRDVQRSCFSDYQLHRSISNGRLQGSRE
jgi:hypothetical protein